MKTLLTKAKSVGLFLLIGLFASSCEFLLEEIPQDALAIDVVFDNPTLARQAIIGMYDELQDPNHLGSRTQLYSDILGADIENQTNNGSTAYGIFLGTWAATSGDITAQWDDSYESINTANIVIENLPNSPLTPAEIAQGLGDAYFIRAISYMYLVAWFGETWYNAGTAGGDPGVILRTEAELSPANEDVPRSSVQAIYDQIYADLALAEANLPSLTAGGNIEFASQEAAIAMRMRALFWQSRWADVITEGNKLVVGSVAPFSSTGGITLVDSANYLSIFNTHRTVEGLFTVVHNTQDRPNTQQNLPGFYRTTVGDYYLGDRAGFGINLFPANDGRRRLFAADATRPIFWLNKYPDIVGFADWAPIIRYADVLLMLAEAEARAGSTTRAAALLDAVRNRAGIGPVGTTTQGPLIDSILIERRREFIGEGYRYYDIRRLNADIPVREDISNATEMAIPAGNFRYRFPIPQTELDRNSEARQNPGY